jgi:glycosyltransferase involved in cell wall biosynthesis
LVHALPASTVVSNRSSGVIGVSLLTLDPWTVGGTQTYARGLVRALAAHGALDYRVYVSEIAPDAGGDLRTVVVPEFPAGRGRLGRIAGLTRATLFDRRLRRALCRERAQAFHFPLTVMLPRVGAPSATTIHDLQHEAFPQFFSRPQLTYRRHVYGRSIRASRIVIAVSKHVRDDLVVRLGYPRENVRVIYHGFDHGRFSPDSRAREPFLLYPANWWPHKNHELLLEALAAVRRERPELRLVLTGSGHPGALPEGVSSLGRVSDERLVDLYRSASALVFPSLYEGFGLPPLEAMACDCPVAVSRVASLPEVCGDAAVYFDPTSVDDVARGIAEVLDRPPGGGPERAALFTWEEFARRHDAVYRELAG